MLCSCFPGPGFGEYLQGSGEASSLDFSQAQNSLAILFRTFSVHFRFHSRNRFPSFSSCFKEMRTSRQMFFPLLLKVKFQLLHRIKHPLKLPSVHRLATHQRSIDMNNAVITDTHFSGRNPVYGCFYSLIRRPVAAIPCFSLFQNITPSPDVYLCFGNKNTFMI